jgi:hypothetical membrane protein
MASRLDRFLILSGIVAAVILIAFSMIIIGFFFPGYSHILESISRQGASDSPVSLATNISFSLTGVFVILFGFGLYRIFGKDKFGKFGIILVVLAGISCMLVGVFPVDPPGMEGSLSNVYHNYSATLAGVLGIVAAALFGIKEYRREDEGRFWAILIPVLLIPSIFFGTLFMLGHPWILPIYGLSERICLGLIMVLVLIISLHLYRTGLSEKNNQE